ncbi:MAG: hypothetical protein ABL998_18605, partial [Planctomycetota bacterium]
MSDDRTFKASLLGEVADHPRYKNDFPETTMHATSPRPFALLFARLLGVAALLGAFASAQEVLGPDERELVARMLRRGEVSEALTTLDEVLDELPEDRASRALRGRARYLTGDYEGAVADVDAALAEGGALAPAEAADAARIRLELATELGRTAELGGSLPALRARLDPAGDPRDAWTLARFELEAGRRKEALALFQQGSDSLLREGWEVLLARARCQRALGFLERSAETVVAADKLARDGDGSEPEILVELGELYFEVYGETDSPVSRAHSPGLLAREALRIDHEHEGARLLLFQLSRWNWTRTQDSPEELLEAVFTARPASLAGLLARTSAALDDGDLPTARTALARLLELAPLRRAVRAEQAALAWIEHRRDEARALLAQLAEEDAAEHASDGGELTRAAGRAEPLEGRDVTG